MNVFSSLFWPAAQTPPHIQPRKKYFPRSTVALVGRVQTLT